jgi:hypothetical protein
MNGADSQLHGLAVFAPAMIEHKTKWALERVSMLHSREKSLVPAGNQKTIARSSNLKHIHDID